jgi:hypothetical protein
MDMDERSTSLRTKLTPELPVWVGTPGAGTHLWSKGEVVRVDKEKVTVRLSKLEGDMWMPCADVVEVERALVDRANASQADDCEDLAELSNLNQQAVLELIRVRYLSAKCRHAAGERPSGIYTRAGVVIVAMNPFTPVDALYTDEQVCARGGPPSILGCWRPALDRLTRTRRILRSAPDGSPRALCAAPPLP